MPITDFEELDIWKLSRELTKQVYEMSKRGAFSKDYVLRDQLRRSVVSIMSNIAEGFERGGNQEFIQFLSVARGSCGEARSQMYAVIDQGYVDGKKGDAVIASCRQLSTMISNHMLYLKKSGFKGQKYKKTVS